jgi:hypothetical protein
MFPMKPNHVSTGLRSSLLVCLLTAVAWIAPAQPATGEASDVAALRAEVQRLARELLESRAEVIEWKMHTITAELRQVERERQRLASDRQTIEREIGELNLASTNGPGREDEGRREELTSVLLPAVLEGERAASAREATLGAALGAEDARRAEIRKRMQRITPEITGRR